ncbi:MAG: hypothetical protein K2Y23_05480 [Cyanobacteria bacterium]|nr:hypothetical protein [Cyanobacteriota bacterium]
MQQQRVVRAFPVRAGREQTVSAFVKELSGTRAREARAFYEKFGIAQECWFQQHTAHGMLVIAITDFSGRTPDDAATEYAASTAPFEEWFKDRVLDITGVDPTKAPLGPPTSCIFDWPPQRQ